MNDRGRGFGAREKERELEHAARGERREQRQRASHAEDGLAADPDAVERWNMYTT